VKVRNNASKILFINSEEKIPLVRRTSRYRWKNNINIMSKETEYENMGLIQVAQDEIR
jgi:hypothetical protein